MAIIYPCDATVEILIEADRMRLLTITLAATWQKTRKPRRSDVHPYAVAMGDRAYRTETSIDAALAEPIS